MKTSKEQSTQAAPKAGSQPAAPAQPTLAQQLGNAGLLRILQAKLTVSDPQDHFEQEADRVADQVMRMPDVVAGSTPAPSSIQTTTVQRAADATSALPVVDAALEEAVAGLDGRGGPLSPEVRSFMEPRFGADLGAVRIHTDAHAHDLARSVNARAFTVGRNVVFGAGYYAPQTDSGRRLLAHELTHVVQQSASRAAIGRVIQREADADDPWSKLSPAGRKRAQQLYEQCMDLIGRLADAQSAHHSVLRGRWIDFLSHNVLHRIGELHADDRIAGVDTTLQDYSAVISRSVADFFDEWSALEQRYQDERDWLLRQQGRDSALAAKRLDDVYGEAKRWLERGAMAYITDEDYSLLKVTLEQGRHISLGVLQNARARVKLLEEMLDVVAELRIDGVDAQKYLPGWQDQVKTEANSLEMLAKRTGASVGTDYPREFTAMREHLLRALDATLKTRKRERPLLGKIIDLASGATDAIVGPLVEAAKQAVDLVQINLHFVTLGHYEPKFISDLSKAAEQGATTSDLLKGMVVGLLETPKRFINAVEDGDWEAIGREAVNLYLLAKAIKESPRYFEKLPELVAKTERGLRILRARTVGNRLSEPRLLPPAAPAPLPPEPVILRPQAPVPAKPQGTLTSNTTNPPPRRGQQQQGLQTSGVRLDSGSKQGTRTSDAGNAPRGQQQQQTQQQMTKVPPNVATERIRQIGKWEEQGKIVGGDTKALRDGLRKGSPEAEAEYLRIEGEIKRGNHVEVEPVTDTPAGGGDFELISTAGKQPLRNSPELRALIPDQNLRNKFMAWLKENHVKGDLGDELPLAAPGKPSKPVKSDGGAGSPAATPDKPAKIVKESHAHLDLAPAELLPWVKRWWKETHGKWPPPWRPNDPPDTTP